MEEEKTIENVMTSEPETIPESEAETSDSVGGGTESEEISEMTVDYTEHFELLYKYESAQISLLVVISLLLLCIFGSQLVRAFWGR